MSSIQAEARDKPTLIIKTRLKMKKILLLLLFCLTITLTQGMAQGETFVSNGPDTTSVYRQAVRHPGKLIPMTAQTGIRHDRLDPLWGAHEVTTQYSRYDSTTKTFETVTGIQLSPIQTLDKWLYFLVKGPIYLLELCLIIISWHVSWKSDDDKKSTFLWLQIINGVAFWVVLGGHAALGYACIVSCVCFVLTGIARGIIYHDRATLRYYRIQLHQFFRDKKFNTIARYCASYYEVYNHSEKTQAITATIQEQSRQFRQIPIMAIIMAVSVGFVVLTWGSSVASLISLAFMYIPITIAVSSKSREHAIPIVIGLLLIHCLMVHLLGSLMATTPALFVLSIGIQTCIANRGFLRKIGVLFGTIAIFASFIQGSSYLMKEDSLHMGIAFAVIFGAVLIGRAIYDIPASTVTAEEAVEKEEVKQAYIAA